MLRMEDLSHHTYPDETSRPAEDAIHERDSLGIKVSCFKNGATAVDIPMRVPTSKKIEHRRMQECLPSLKADEEFSFNNSLFILGDFSPIGDEVMNLHSLKILCRFSRLVCWPLSD